MHLILLYNHREISWCRFVTWFNIFSFRIFFKTSGCFYLTQDTFCIGGCLALFAASLWSNLLSHTAMQMSFLLTSELRASPQEYTWNLFFLKTAQQARKMAPIISFHHTLLWYPNTKQLHFQYDNNGAYVSFITTAKITMNGTCVLCLPSPSRLYPWTLTSITNVFAT